MYNLFRISACFAFLCLFYNCQTDKPTQTSKSVFRYNETTAITSLDPAFAKNKTNIWAVNHLFNGLVQLDDKLEVQPAIAKSWQISKDGLTYTFNLRDDVFFHDNICFANGKGRQVVATDFVYSLERILDTKVGSPGAWIFRNRVQEKRSFEALNDSTLVIHLSKAFRPMLGILTMQYCSVVPKEAIAKYGKSFRKNPVGTGPFLFKKWIEGQSLILNKNTNYFEQDIDGSPLPYLDAVRVDFHSDHKTAFLEFKKGNLDFLASLDPSFIDALLTKEGQLKDDWKNSINFSKAPFLNTEYFGILMDEETMKTHPLHHKSVRQALNYAFDRTAMLRALTNGIGVAANSSFTPRGLPSFNQQNVQGYTYDLVKARKLLADAGFPDGKGLAPFKLKTNKDYLDICTYITKKWEDIGIKVEIELIEAATLRELMAKGQASFFRASWIADYPDAENFCTLYYGENPAPPNYTQFRNTAYDKLYEEALSENNDLKRYDLYQKMNKILIEEAPAIFLYYDETARFSYKYVKGLSNNALNLLSLKKVKVEK